VEDKRVQKIEQMEVTPKRARSRNTQKRNNVQYKQEKTRNKKIFLLRCFREDFTPTVIFACAAMKLNISFPATGCQKLIEV